MPIDENENADYEYGEITLSDYDSKENADNEPSESEDSNDELEFNSDASVSLRTARSRTRKRSW